MFFTYELMNSDTLSCTIRIKKLPLEGKTPRNVFQRVYPASSGNTLEELFVHVMSFGLFCDNIGALVNIITDHATSLLQILLREDQRTGHTANLV